MAVPAGFTKRSDFWYRDGDNVGPYGIGPDGQPFLIGGGEIARLFDPCQKARSGKILTEDTFLTDNCDWQQLFTPSTTTGTAWGTVSRVKGRGPSRMVLRTPNVASATSMAIKRMSNATGDGRYLVEFLLSIENVTALTDRPRYADFGVDTCLSDGTRRYFKVRFLNYDETSNTQVQKFQLFMGTTPGYVDVVGGAYPWMTVTNENKALPMYCALVFNTTTGLYEGFRFGRDIQVGSLAATPDTTLQAMGAIVPDSLTTFKNGLNSCVEIVNRSAASQTASCVGIHFHRLTYLGS